MTLTSSQTHAIEARRLERQTALLLALALASLLYAGSRTTIERECRSYRSSIEYSPEIGHYIVGSLQCSEWGGFYSRDRKGD